MTVKLVFLSVSFLALVGGGLAISFRLEPGLRKCIKEEVHKDVLVVGEYRLSELAGQRTDILVGVGRTCGPRLGEFRVPSKFRTRCGVATCMV